MFDRDRWLEIFGSIRSNVLRTVLSGFTVALGLFIFIVLFGIGNGLQNSFSKNFFGDAANLISIFTRQTMEPYQGMQANRNITFNNNDFEAVVKNNQAKVTYAAPKYETSMQVKYNNESGNYRITGSNAAEQTIEDRDIRVGRYINQRDVDLARNVAVIGQPVQRDLIKRGAPIGKTINLNGHSFKVIGVFTDAGGDWQANTITIPISTLQKLKKSSDTINSMYLVYNKNLSTQQAVALGEHIEKQLKQKHRVAPDDKGGVIVRNTAESMKDTIKFMFVLTLIVGVIGLGTLIAGVLGISNIMVYIVKERTKEIGVRKAIGAHPKDIVGLIMQESILITVISGLIGVVLGILSLQMIGNSLEKYFISNPGVGMGIVTAAFFCLILAGAIAGFIPAYRASKIKPIEALREE